MGKHERGEVEKAEKIIVKIHNNEEINEEDKKIICLNIFVY